MKIRIKGKGTVLADVVGDGLLVFIADQPLTPAEIAKIEKKFTAKYRYRSKKHEQRTRRQRTSHH